jgi:hypothetical protein
MVDVKNHSWCKIASRVMLFILLTAYSTFKLSTLSYYARDINDATQISKAADHSYGWCFRAEYFV